MNKTIFFLISIFLLISVALFPQQPNQLISVQSFRALPNDMDARIDFPKIDQNGDKCAIIKVVTTETGFAWDLGSIGIVAAEKKIGEYWLYVPYGAKRITIKHDKLGVLRDYVFTEAIREASVYELVLTTGKVTTIVEEIETPMQWFTIATQPDEADVYINDQYMGITPYQKKLETGRYNYRIEKSMYHSSAGIITLSEEKTEALELTLNPNFGYVKITSSPESGASIEIDGLPMNEVTPLTSNALLSGEHRLILKKIMFQPKTIDFEIIDGQTTELNVDLVSNFATVTVQTLPDVDIYIDDEKKGTGTYTGRLMPGLHTFEAKNDKYRPDKKQQEFVAGEEQSIILNPTAIIGSVDIMTTPFGASIKLDGKDMGVTPTTLKDLLVGTYTLSLEKENYGSISKIISITVGQTTMINETLPAGIEITINSDPQNATLYVDGQKKGTTPSTVTLSFGEHQIKVNNQGTVSEDKITIVQNGKTSFNFDVDPKRTGTFTDTRDNQTYKWKKIGNQIWMAENLYFKNIKGSWCYENDEIKCQTYGRLYNWETAKKSCPNGWHLPTDIEWNKLIDYLEGEKIAGGKMKRKDNIQWKSPNESATNESGFTALPAGYRDNSDTFYYRGYYAYFWSATECNSSIAWYRYLYFNTSEVIRDGYPKDHGFSVRCLKDN
ncbi:FISUMP domain-containing protein [Bacteroidota bacterium]